ncbi:arylamine N-acetyltransferase [Streptomyces sp. M19]
MTRLLGRVRRGSDRVRCRAHALAAVMAGHQLWLVDVGFGDDGPVEPVPLEVGAVVRADGGPGASCATWISGWCSPCVRTAGSTCTPSGSSSTSRSISRCPTTTRRTTPVRRSPAG